MQRVLAAARSHTQKKLDGYFYCDFILSKSAAMYVVRVFIHASVHCAIMTSTVGHQVSFVLACPSRRTHVTTWYHHLCSTCCHVTYSTWDIVLEDTTGIYARECFIFGPIDFGNFITRYRFFINWITCQAYVVRSTALFTIMRSSDITCRFEKRLM